MQRTVCGQPHIAFVIGEAGAALILTLAQLTKPLSDAYKVVSDPGGHGDLGIWANDRPNLKCQSIAR